MSSPEGITVIQDFDTGSGQKRVAAYTKNPPAVSIANDQINAKLFLNYLNDKLSAGILAPFGTMTNHSDKGTNYKVFVAGTSNPTESDKQYLVDVFNKVNKISSNSAVVKSTSFPVTIPVDRDEEIVRLQAENIKFKERIQALEKQLASQVNSTGTPPPLRPANPMMSGIFAELKKKTAEAEPYTSSTATTTRRVNPMAAMFEELKQKAGGESTLTKPQSLAPQKAVSQPLSMAEQARLIVESRPKSTLSIDEQLAARKEEAAKRKQQKVAQDPLSAGLAQRQAAREGRGALDEQPKTTTTTPITRVALPEDEFEKKPKRSGHKVKKADDDDW